jgi:hypothetical protein
MIYPGGWRREEQRRARRTSWSRRRQAPLVERVVVGRKTGGGLGGISSPALLARRPKGEGGHPIKPRANGQPCLDSGARRISRGWCAWNSTPRRFRHTHTHTHIHTCIHAHVVPWASPSPSPCCMAAAHSPVLSCPVLRCPARSGPVAALSRLSSSPRPRLQRQPHAPRNYDLRRWRFLCRDWQLALPARRRGYRWVVALLTLRFQTSASTLPLLWPSTYSSRGWVSARLWLRLGLTLAPTCPNLLNLAVARKPHRPVAAPLPASPIPLLRPRPLSTQPQYQR